jgi:hypothetical protein
MLIYFDAEKSTNTAYINLHLEPFLELLFDIEPHRRVRSCMSDKDVIHVQEESNAVLDIEVGVCGGLLETDGEKKFINFVVTRTTNLVPV